MVYVAISYVTLVQELALCGGSHLQIFAVVAVLTVNVESKQQVWLLKTEKIRPLVQKMLVALRRWSSYTMHFEWQTLRARKVVAKSKYPGRLNRW